MKKDTSGAKPKQTETASFDDWSLDAINKPKEWLDRIIRSGVAEAFYASAEGRAYCNVAYDGGPVPDDPTDFEVEIIQSDVGDGDVKWTFSIAEVVEKFIDAYNSPRDGGMIVGEGEEYAAALRDALRKLADDLDARLRKPASGDAP
jgi:hypothetical protein